jgi:hypothetical protein
MTYAEETDIEGMFGYAIDATGTSRPTTAQLAVMLIQADAIINAEARVSSNLTDTSKRLKAIACSLILKMVNNMFSLTDPSTFGFVEVELSDDQKRVIHMEHSVWNSLHWNVGG